MAEAQQDQVEVWRGEDGWRWRRFNGENGKQVSESGEGYEHRGHAITMAEGLNPDANVYVTESQNEVP